MISTNTIEILKDLSEFEFENQVYDFHNDYDCKKICFENGTLILMFQKRVSGFLLSLKFHGVDISKALFFNISSIENLTIDTIYRGRVVVNEVLLELSNNGTAYFYLEFCEGQTLEFWAESIVIDRVEI